MKKSILITIALLIMTGLTGWVVFDNLNKDDAENKVASVTSFEECAEAGYAVMESYPRQCRTPEGEVFVEDIGNELEKTDLIRLETPRPGDTVSSPLTIEGEARGSWFFEASFPVRIYDSEGNELGVAVAQAQDEWMTEEFVPFQASLGFSTPQTATGELVLEKDNPSGLPENADELRIPIKFSSQETSRALDGCVITGCSAHVCADEEVVTTCEYREEYACYNTAVCERQASGECGWTETEELKQCLQNS